MNPVPQSASSPGGKSLNTASSHTPIQQQQSQTTPPTFDSNTRRFTSHSSGIPAAARNNQNQRKQHRNSKKPRLTDEDAMAESTAMRNANSRRGQTSITHLMSFALPPRPQDYRNTITRGTRRGNIYGIGSGHHSSDKARYIHANYRFIVRPYGDYKQQALFADQHLDWSDVLQILASGESQDASCPICLSHPVAPRMAKCGHIFCLPCLIRYMHSTDDTNPIPEKKARWKACPICWDTIYNSETRPVRWYIGQEGPAPREGEDVVLRLVMRQPGSTLALPRDGADVLDKSEDIPWYFAAEVMDYARIMKGSEEYMLEQFDSEIEALKQQENEDELMFGEEPEWTRKAVSSVLDAKEKIKGIGGPPPPPSQPMEKKPKRQHIQFNVVDDNTPEMYFVQHVAKSGLDVYASTLSPSAVPFQLDPVVTATLPTPSNLIPTANPSQLRSKNVHQNEGHSPDSPYFFYQSLLHYYLAPLDIRILKSAFGNFASFPSTLLPRVERVSTHVMDDELRKRTKYLAHLPFGCEVGFLECNWTDVVQPEILNQFKEDIERRRKRNRDKEIREEKDRQRAEKAEDNARWAHARQRQPETSPGSYSDTDYAQLASTSIDPINASPPWTSRQGSSFGALASPSTSPPAPRTVWGTTLVTPSSPDLRPGHDNNADDGWLATWEQELQAENDALVAQVQAVSLNGESSSSATPQPQGKRKKGKKITLMSTTARRAA
ncbi:0911a4be-bd0f-4322-b642-7cfae0d2c70f [Sclerotinia trifoliorum]|uniref:0911a4be-bd0f-4322-b642-7cfae0d2c70f n=1 Tax=Sclerotinia trifoliorum TaxID=28548 RepID=A0A8H2VU40_9HELO|nr:0911a4be-bd0f-4322-b642-7cfae0d2c70f [Sclerotinia trifoliorum]